MTVETRRRYADGLMYNLRQLGIIGEDSGRAAKVFFAAVAADFDRALTLSVCGPRLDGFTRTEVDRVYDRMESCGIWSSGKWRLEYSEGPELQVEIALHILVAEGVVEYHSSCPTNTKAAHP